MAVATKSNMKAALLMRERLILSRRAFVEIVEIARRAQRDVRAVHSDVHVLLRAGVLEKAEDGGDLFPYDAIHLDFLLKAA